MRLLDQHLESLRKLPEISMEGYLEELLLLPMLATT